MDDSDNDRPPGQNSTPGYAGVTVTDLHNM